MTTRTMICINGFWLTALLALGSIAHADDKPFILADFEDETANELIAIQAKAAGVTLAGNNALSIATEEGADYPGVLIKPEQGKWDLSEYDVVKMDVFNPQSVQVRVLLSVANPGSDGTKNCNTEAVVVQPGKKATLDLPFGTWHGETNRPIDQSNVVSAQVMLDRPGQAHQFTVDNIRAEKFSRRHMAGILRDPFAEKMKPILGRGVNLGNALDAPNEGEWGVTLEERYFDLLNEPHNKLTAQLWNEMLVEAIKVVRRTNPTRQIVVGPGSWNAVSALEGLELPKDDRNLIVTFHYYSPFQFTHQGASWVGGNANKWLGTKWQATRPEQEAVRRDLDRALAWAVKNKRQIYLGEFGAYSKTDMESRARWTKFVADEAIQRNISIAYWEFCAGFGVYDATNNRWRDPLKRALLPE